MSGNQEKSDPEEFNDFSDSDADPEFIASGAKSYKCQKCLRRFKQLHVLKRHQQRKADCSEDRDRLPNEEEDSDDCLQRKRTRGDFKWDSGYDSNGRGIKKGDELEGSDEEEWAIRCLLCEKMFKTSEELSSHVLEAHNDDEPSSTPTEVPSSDQKESEDPPRAETKDSPKESFTDDIATMIDFEVPLAKYAPEPIKIPKQILKAKMKAVREVMNRIGTNNMKENAAKLERAGKTKRRPRVNRVSTSVKETKWPKAPKESEENKKRSSAFKSIYLTSLSKEMSERRRRRAQAKKIQKIKSQNNPDQPASTNSAINVNADGCKPINVFVSCDYGNVHTGQNITIFPSEKTSINENLENNVKKEQISLPKLLNGSALVTMKENEPKNKIVTLPKPNSVMNTNFQGKMQLPAPKFEPINTNLKTSPFALNSGILFLPKTTSAINSSLNGKMQLPARKFETINTNLKTSPLHGGIRLFPKTTSVINTSFNGKLQLPAPKFETINTNLKTSPLNGGIRLLPKTNSVINTSFNGQMQLPAPKLEKINTNLKTSPLGIHKILNHDINGALQKIRAESLISARNKINPSLLLARLQGSHKVRTGAKTNIIRKIAPKNTVSGQRQLVSSNLTGANNFANKNVQNQTILNHSVNQPGTIVNLNGSNCKIEPGGNEMLINLLNAPQRKTVVFPNARAKVNAAGAVPQNLVLSTKGNVFSTNQKNANGNVANARAQVNAAGVVPRTLVLSPSPKGNVFSTKIMNSETIQCNSYVKGGVKYLRVIRRVKTGGVKKLPTNPIDNNEVIEIPDDEDEPSKAEKMMNPNISATTWSGRAYRCQKCNQSFQNLIHLQEHKKIHQPTKRLVPTFNVQPGEQSKDLVSTFNLKPAKQSHINATQMFLQYVNNVNRGQTKNVLNMQTPPVTLNKGLVSTQTITPITRTDTGVESAMSSPTKLPLIEDRQLCTPLKMLPVEDDSDLNILKDEKDQSEITKDLLRFEHYICGYCEKPFTNLIHLEMHFASCRTYSYPLKGEGSAVYAQMFSDIQEAKRSAQCMERDGICFCCGDSFRVAHIGYIRCPHCPKSFRNFQSLDRHLIFTHARIDDFKCDVCNAKCPSEFFLTLHKKSHTRGKPYVCKTCGMEFSTVTQSWRHTISAEAYAQKRQVQFPCEKCGKIFKQTNLLRLHSLVCRKRLECDCCERINLKEESKVHNITQSYKCIMCLKTFKKQWMLNSHLLSHIGESLHAADIREQLLREKLNINAEPKSIKLEASCDTREENVINSPYVCENTSQIPDYKYFDEPLMEIELDTSAPTFIETEQVKNKAESLEVKNEAESSEVKNEAESLEVKNEAESLEVKNEAESLEMSFGDDLIEVVQLENDEGDVDEIRPNIEQTLDIVAVKNEPLQRQICDGSPNEIGKDNEVYNDTLEIIDVDDDYNGTTVEIIEKEPNNETMMDMDVSEQQTSDISEDTELVHINSFNKESPEVPAQNNTVEIFDDVQLGSENYVEEVEIISENTVMSKFRTELHREVEELLKTEIGESTLKDVGWPVVSIDEALSNVIKQYGYTPVPLWRTDSLSENTRLFLSISMGADTVNRLLKNNSLSGVIRLKIKISSLEINLRVKKPTESATPRETCRTTVQ